MTKTGEVMKVARGAKSLEQFEKKLSMIWTFMHQNRFAGRICIFFIAIFTASAAIASFEDLGTGARATAMGGAFTPLADDLNALYYNPAGLVYLKRKEIAASYGLLHTGLTDKSKISNSYVAYGHPIKAEFGTVGVSWQQMSVEDLYMERTIAFGYGRRLSQKWAAGINFKQLYRQFTAPTGATDNTGFIDTSKTDPVFSFGNSKSSIGMDFGLLFRPYRNYSYGLMLQNFNEPNMAIADTDRDALGMTLRTGVAYNERTLTLVGELDTKKTPSGNGRDTFMTAAGEKWWLGAGFAQADLALRGSLAFGSRSFSQMGMGFTYRLQAIQVDYAFVMPLSGIGFGSSQGNHRVTFTLRFGKTLVDSDYEYRAKAAEIAAKKAEEELEQARKESEQLQFELDKLKQESEKHKAVVEETRQKSGKEAASKELSARFADAMDKYWRRKSQGAGIEERIGILSQIEKEFSGAGIEISVTQKELAIAKSDRAKAEADLAISWSYYQKIVARGASVPERIELLSRMIERFARSGVDLTNVRDEMKSLRGR